MDLRKRARELRSAMTPQEVRLWSELKLLNRQGHHFRRQALADGYILDFAEFTARLVIEVDGSQHGFDNHIKKDASRDAHFESAGFRVIRVWNNEVSTNLDGVMHTIIDAPENPHPRPAGGPSPRKRGRDK